MDLLKSLSKLGGKLGIVQMVSATPPESPRKIVTRKVSLADLAQEIRSQEVQMLAERPAELTIAFDRVFEAAGIKAPCPGCTVEELVNVLRLAEYQNLDRRAVQVKLAAWMDQRSIDVSGVVQDAVARDKALDAFAESVHRKLQERAAVRGRRLAELDGQIQSLQQEHRRLRQEEKDQAQQWREWKRRKVACERDMSWAVGFVLDKPTISIDDDGD